MKRKGLIALGVALLLASCANSGNPMTQGNVPGVVKVKARSDVELLRKIGRGTGVLVDGRYVLTVAHNLLDEDLGYVNLVVVDGAPARVWEVSSRYQANHATGNFQKSDPEMLENDLGFIDLGQKFPPGYGFQLNRGNSGLVSVGQPVQVAGFPLGRKAVTGTGRITAVKGQFFGYDVATTKGMSGAPIWVEREGRRVMIGIHLGSDLLGIQGAVARRVDQNLLREWDQWRNKGL